MPSFEQLRQSVNPQARMLLDFVWDHYLTKSSWPTIRVVYGRFKKEDVIPLLRTLVGALMREVDSNGQKVLQLPLLGILSTSHGDKYLSLLKRYLEHLRDVYFNQQDVDSIKHTEVQNKLNLTPEDTAMLGRLVFSGFLNSSGGYQPNFTSWGLSLPTALDDLPSSGELDSAFVKILDDLATPPQRMFLSKHVAGATSALSSAPVLSDEDSKLPKVFISYSHDGKEHKMWVLELALKLHHADIEVILDQWELGPGDDIVKFMEHGVTQAERVLMICTEPYVRKVNEGDGGAGYEGTVVTGELIRDLGTAKFIPVIRQAGGSHVLPTCVSTRAWIDLSAGAEAEEELNKLISSLRREPPATKPPRRSGVTNTSSDPAAVSSPPPQSAAATPAEPHVSVPGSPANGAAPPDPSPAPLAQASVIATFPSDPVIAYQQALSLARSGDLVTWRKLVAAKKFASEEALKTWRESAQKAPLPRKKGELPEFARPGVATQQPLLAVALAGVESGQPKFNQQAGLVYDLMKPKGWDRSGLSLVGDFPETNAFVFQALLGAMAVYSNQNVLAIDLATQRIANRDDSTISGPLFLDHPLAGWPDSFDTNAQIAWQFLWVLPDHFPWIVEAFGSADTFRESLCGYYLLLSWLEFLEFLRKQPDFDGSQKLRLEVPPLFLRAPLHVSGARKLLDDRQSLLRYSERSQIPVSKQLAAWPHWVSQLSHWLGQVFHHPWEDTQAYEITHFAADLHR